jgi:hypothetical protein
MKKLFLSAVLAVGCLVGVNAQSTGFEAGAYVGLPMGDAKDATSLNIGISAGYYWDVADSFKVGVLTGYDHWIGKTIKEEFMGTTVEFEVDDFGFIPIAASAKYDFGSSLFAGVDLGYAIYVGSGEGDGGFLYQPKFGYSGASFDAFAFYKGISNDGSISSLGAGFAYKF